jgi:hypothetical protein
MVAFPPEQDWKTLRALHPLALDRYCKRVLQEITSVAGETSRSAHERYLAIYALVGRRNRDMADAFDDMRRSTAILKIAHIYALGLLTEDEFARFSDVMRDQIRRIVV